MRDIEISFFVAMDSDKIKNSRPLQEWSELLMLEHDLDLGIVATWNDVYHAIALANLAGGDYSEFVGTSGWDIDNVAGGSDPTLGVDVDVPPNAGSAG